MKFCIFCGTKSEKVQFADEHVFPDALGGLLVLKNMVCKTCNDKLGHTVDGPLVNNGLMSIVRLTYGLKGKSGKVPNPFEKGVLVSDPNKKIKYELTKDGKPKRTYLVPQINVTKKDEAVELSINIDESDRNKIPLILKKISKRHNIHIPEKDFKKFLKTPSEEFSPAVRNSIVIDLDKCRKAILKIAYELGCYWIGDAYFDDPIAVTLREAILSKNSLREFAQHTDLKGSIDVISGNSMFSFLNNKKSSHIALSMLQNGITSCYVRVFMQFEGMILLSRNSSCYPDFKGQFVEINVRNSTIRESSFLDEIYKEIKNGTNDLGA